MSVNLEDARRVIAAAEKKAAQIGQPMNIDEAPAGCRDFDKGASKKFVLNPHGLRI
jgi:hypothetical protein